MPSTGSPVVLVVEDEALVRDYIATFLRDVGYPVLETDTAEHAIAMMDTCVRIDIVLTDINLNGKLTGWDLAEAFRAAQPQIPVIYVSGNPADYDRLVPESVFFKKPYDPEAILRSLQEFT